MDSSNHWYGHAHILSEYCGLDPESPPRIDGVVQHGWTFVHGYGYGHAPPEGFAKYVWSDVCRRRGQIIGWRDYVTIGAPFEYLKLIEPEDPGREREGTIWYPFHGTADFEQMTGNHERLIEEIHAVEDGPVTMCLYYVEYERPEIRKVYEDAGFRVISHGQRGTKWQGTTNDFLRRQIRELRTHRRVASNRLTTAVFYGISAGCEAGVYGDPMELVGVKAGFNGQNLLEHTFPMLHGAHIDLAQARPVVDAEMGADVLASPEELRFLLGWESYA